MLSPQALCPGCGAKPHPAGRTQCPAYYVSCHNCKKVGHFARVCRSKPVQPTEVKPPQPSTSALQFDSPFLKNLVCLTSIMLHLQTLHPSYRSKSSLLMVPSPQLSFQTLVQIFQPLVLVFSHNLMNTLTICYLPQLSPKLLMEPRCTPLGGCQYASRLVISNTLMTWTFTPMSQAH